MKLPRKLLVAVAAASLFSLLLMGATAALMLAGAPDAAGVGRTAEERVVVLVVLLLFASAFCGWLIVWLHDLYAASPLRMAEEVTATMAHSDLRVGEQGAAELRVLAQAVNQLL
ncbi:MAG TPA: DNA polymerase III subunit epsilon, partial [Candidatus Accumulibacter sp.]|nr:DNA polymerase III subunit epsilon [Accumulibacter sp.]